jgi:dTDP-4-dehydrorhamnose reductase
MKILILGSSGMLGKYVYTYFCKYYKNVIGIKRSDFEVNINTNSESINSLFNKYNISENDIVINCIGLIKPQVDKYGTILSIIVNSLFPNLLADACQNIKCKMIHITTDCVFSGKKGAYIENDIHDVSDTYGRTKSLGEPTNCTVIRTSIIGEEVGQKRSLVEWIKSNSNKEINGFEDHLWNGLTCLQVAKVIDQLIQKNEFWNGVRHIYSNTVNKYELASIINEIYNLNIKINKVKSGNFCDRSMSSIYQCKVEIPPLKQQIEDMKEFKKILENN